MRLSGKWRGKLGATMFLAVVITIAFTTYTSAGRRSGVGCERTLSVDPHQHTTSWHKDSQVTPAHPATRDTEYAHEPLESGFATVQITKVKDVEFADDPEAFFMSILAVNGSLFAAYRTTLSSWETKVIKMDASFAPSANEQGRRIPNTEDARVIEFQGEGWLIDNHFLQPRAMTSLDGRYHVVLKTTELGNDFERGKNWAPFVYQSRLFFVYSLSPLRVLECTMPEGTLRWVHGVSRGSGNPKGLGDMLKRGGTNGIVHDNHVYGIGRETMYENIVCSGAQHANVAQHYPFLWRFHVSLLDSAVPFNETSARSDDIEIRKIEHPFNHGVNDPASLFVHDSALYLTVSSCACACLPEFRTSNAWQRNSVYRVQLKER